MNFFVLLIIFQLIPAIVSQRAYWRGDEVPAREVGERPYGYRGRVTVATTTTPPRISCLEKYDAAVECIEKKSTQSKTESGEIEKEQLGDANGFAPGKIEVKSSDSKESDEVDCTAKINLFKPCCPRFGKKCKEILEMEATVKNSKERKVLSLNVKGVAVQNKEPENKNYNEGYASSNYGRDVYRVDPLY